MLSWRWAVERAFTLARTTQYSSVEAIRKQLLRENYDQMAARGLRSRRQVPQLR